MDTELSFLGTGWSFPPTFNNQLNTVTMVSGEEDIAQSLQILLGTRPGERVMQPAFGCNLDVMLFESITATLITQVRDLIETAILYYEPRIELNSIEINSSDTLEGVVLIELDYTVKANNSRFNMVVPFFTGSFSQIGNLEKPKELITF
jgi:hypothetical protein